MSAKAFFSTCGCRWWSLLLPFVTLSAAAPQDLDVISKIPGDRSDFKMVSKKISEDGKEAVFTLLEPTGIFAFRLDLSGTKFSKLTLVIQKQRFCEGLTFQLDGQQAIDLKSVDGVRIAHQEGDLSIEFGPAALEKLKPGGRFQFINQYR